MDSSDSDHLLQFINNKIKNNDNESIDDKNLYFLYITCIRSALVATFNSSLPINININKCIICKDIVNNIFWTIYRYSKNARLTTYICDRAILLFNEYINLSTNFNYNSFTILDVKTFVINKTIGPLSIYSSHKIVNEIEIIHSLAMTYNSFLTNIFTNIINNNPEIDKIDLGDLLQSICSILLNIFYKVFKLGFINYVYDICVILESTTIKLLPKEVNISKIYLELFIFIYNKTKDGHKSIHIIEELMNSEYDILYNEDELGQYLNHNQPLIENNIYQHLVDKINIYLNIKS
jgi:hypothetical protein